MNRAASKILIESYSIKMTFKYWFEITKLTILIWPIIYKEGKPPWFQNTTLVATLVPKYTRKASRLYSKIQHWWQPWFQNIQKRLATALDSTSRSYIWCYKVQLRMIKIWESPRSFMPISPWFSKGTPRLRIQTIAPMKHLQASLQFCLLVLLPPVIYGSSLGWWIRQWNHPFWMFEVHSKWHWRCWSLVFNFLMYD